MKIIIVSKKVITSSGSILTFQCDEDRIQTESWEDAEIELFLQGKSNTHTIEGELVYEEYTDIV